MLMRDKNESNLIVVTVIEHSFTITVLCIVIMSDLSYYAYQRSVYYAEMIGYFEATLPVPQ